MLWIDSRSFNAYLKSSKKSFELNRNIFSKIDNFQNILNVSQIFKDKNQPYYNVTSTDLIKSSDLVICFPFTTPAYEAYQLKKDVFFYDPIILGENTKLSRNIPIIRGKLNCHPNLINMQKIKPNKINDQLFKKNINLIL